MSDEMLVSVSTVKFLQYLRSLDVRLTVQDGNSPAVRPKAYYSRALPGAGPAEAADFGFSATLLDG